MLETNIKVILDRNLCRQPRSIAFSLSPPALPFAFRWPVASLNRRCLYLHRSGVVAPFSLLALQRDLVGGGGQEAGAKRDAAAVAANAGLLETHPRRGG